MSESIALSPPINFTVFKSLEFYAQEPIEMLVAIVSSNSCVFFGL